MKLIEALKRTKMLKKRIEDLHKKIHMYSADFENDKPTYEGQESQIKAWLDSCRDSVMEIMRLKLSIQRTNINTIVSIAFEGDSKAVEQSISAWIIRRAELASIQYQTWKMLDAAPRDPRIITETGDKADAKIFHVRRYFDVKQRDLKMQYFTEEPSIIDAKLEIVNAETDIIE